MKIRSHAAFTNRMETCKKERNKELETQERRLGQLRTLEDCRTRSSLLNALGKCVVKKRTSCSSRGTPSCLPSCHHSVITQSCLPPSCILGSRSRRTTSFASTHASSSTYIAVKPKVARTGSPASDMFGLLRESNLGKYTVYSRRFANIGTRRSRPTTRERRRGFDIRMSRLFLPSDRGLHLISAHRS